MARRVPVAVTAPNGRQGYIVYEPWVRAWAVHDSRGIQVAEGYDSYESALAALNERWATSATPPMTAE